MQWPPGPSVPVPRLRPLARDLVPGHGTARSARVPGDRGTKGRCHESSRALQWRRTGETSPGAPSTRCRRPRAVLTTTHGGAGRAPGLHRAKHRSEIPWSVPQAVNTAGWSARTVRLRPRRRQRRNSHQRARSPVRRCRPWARSRCDRPSPNLGVPGMTQAPRLTNQALREAAERLVGERPDLAPGSVLRCFSLSVRTALLRGCPPSQVADEAERVTRALLARRLSGRRHHRSGSRRGVMLVPQPRRGEGS